MPEEDNYPKSRKVRLGGQAPGFGIEKMTTNSIFDIIFDDVVEYLSIRCTQLKK